MTKALATMQDAHDDDKVVVDPKTMLALRLKPTIRMPAPISSCLVPRAGKVSKAVQ
ncbi:hypothetical protein [Xaviernesmea oryzae]|uniref:hypothetical protein n=1 Tax=Xaviernesmea oryzae TaxID=464029 RepID=UPI001F37E43F|nr:hypothetical protein [Xaviernesmea oryzae]